MSLYIPKLFGHTLYCYGQKRFSCDDYHYYYYHHFFFTIFLLYFLTFVDMDGNDVGSRTLTLLGTWIGCLLYLKQEKRWR
jgi:hypothetical protein